MKENYIIDKTNYCGKCPECDHDWNGGLNKDNEPTSLLVKIENSDLDQWIHGESYHYQCPNCNVAWESNSGARTEKFKAMIVEHKVMSDFLDKIMKKNKGK